MIGTHIYCLERIGCFCHFLDQQLFGIVLQPTGPMISMVTFLLVFCSSPHLVILMFEKVEIFFWVSGGYLEFVGVLVSNEVFVGVPSLVP